MVVEFGHKGRYSRSTLRTWTKDELINYIEVLENNERSLTEGLEQQAKNFEFMLNNLKNYKDPIDGILTKEEKNNGIS